MHYRVVSLFSGCGGFCEGVRLAGFATLAAVEIDRFAAETYRFNFPEVPLFQGDIVHFLNDRDPAWSRERARFAEVRRGAVDLVFGGPPCQGYSQIGTRLLGDPRNALYGEFIRVLQVLQPAAFLMENVPNMLLMDKGKFRREVLNAFREAGYGRADVRIVIASDYGVPQVRRRAIFFGVRDAARFPYPVGDWLEAALSVERAPTPTVREAIGDLPAVVAEDGNPLPYPINDEHVWIRRELRLDGDGDHYLGADKRRHLETYELHNHHTKEIQERRLQLISQLAPGMKGDSLPKSTWDGLRPEKWRRLHPDRPAHTILAQMHRDMSEWVHPTLQRWITAREAARLQSFHDGFVFKSSEWQILKQIGNAVPPLLARAVALAARKALDVIDADAGDRQLPPIREPINLAMELV